MSNYTLLNHTNTIGVLPPSPIVRPVPVNERQNLQILSGNVLDPTLPITPPDQQAFQLTVSGVGAVSASAQIYGSNDGKNWLTIGGPITGSGTTTGNVGALGSVGYSFYGALLTAISGTNAVATLTMSC
jgi:hypothetical protein